MERKLKSVMSLFLILLSISMSGLNREEQHVEVIVRMVGYEFLRQIGDSTSRIMPIKKQDGRYLLQFENQMAFEPDVLLFSIEKVFEEANFTSEYIVETENCIAKDIVHSFEISEVIGGDLMPCKGRVLPVGCYQIYFTFLEEKVKPIVAKKEFSGMENLFTYFIVFVIVLGVVLLFLKKKKDVSNFNSEVMQLGAYQFDKRVMKLIYKGGEDELSSKETDLLGLLCSNLNETVTRENILQVVWGDEGDYLGRTLDVFISKLRKKLEADPNLKIINIRGVGYRLVVEN